MEQHNPLVVHELLSTVWLQAGNADAKRRSSVGQEQPAPEDCSSSHYQRLLFAWREAYAAKKQHLHYLPLSETCKKLVILEKKLTITETAPATATHNGNSRASSWALSWDKRSAEAAESDDAPAFIYKRQGRSQLDLLLFTSAGLPTYTAKRRSQLDRPLLVTSFIVYIAAHTEVAACWKTALLNPCR